MNILIIEDEELAVKKLQKTLFSIDETANVVGVTDSIKSSVEWLQDNTPPDLILMDIELADGQSFEVFNLVDVKSPVIFTTSYDEYALKAFKVNSVDYLLKPIQKDELQAALAKYNLLKQDGFQVMDDEKNFTVVLPLIWNNTAEKKQLKEQETAID